MSTSTPAVPTQPLREEHRELLPRIHQLGELADDVGAVEAGAVWTRLAAAHDFLVNHLAPHARAEEAVLYPAVEDAMRAPGATDTMSRDHVDVVARVEQIGRELDVRGPIDAVTARRLRAQLYGLEAVVALHFAKEEEVYLPLLDAALDGEAADELFRRLEEAAAR